MKRKYEKHIGREATDLLGNTYILKGIIHYSDGSNLYQMEEIRKDGTHRNFLCVYSFFWRYFWSNLK